MSIIPVKRLHQPQGHVRTVAPAVEPVTADDLRDYLRETADGLPDAEANALIQEAREISEDMSGIAFNTQTWLLALDTWPGRAAEPWWNGVRQGAISELYGGDGDVDLPRWPLQSVTGINVYASDGTASAVNVSTVFDVDTYRQPGRIAVKFGQSLPVTYRRTNGVEITYVAGYGDDAGDVPAALKRAVKQLAGYLYTHRGDGCEPGVAYRASGAAAILDSKRARRI